MPRPARLPTVEFRSLLLPPIRVHLHTLHAFARPPCAPAALHRASPAAPCLGQRRALHLYKTAKAKTALGMHKVLDFDLYTPAAPSASPHRVNLVRSEHDLRPIAQDVSLQELYDTHLAPGKFLYLAEPIAKKLSENPAQMREENIPAQRNNYAIAPARRITATLKHPQSKRKQLGALKGINLLLANPVGYTREALDRAYQFIEQGSPVEFRVRLLGSVMQKKRSGAPGPPDPDAWPWVHAHFPHLRPDFICRSMPAGTDFLIQPVSDGRCVQFVLGRGAEQMPKVSLTTRLFRVKTAVVESLDKNPMAQQWQMRKARKMGLDGAAEGVEESEGGGGGGLRIATAGKRAKAQKEKQRQPSGSEADAEEQARILADARSGARGLLTLGDEGHGGERVEGAEEKLVVVTGEARKWRRQYAGDGGVDRRGVWEKKKPVHGKAR